MEEGERREGGKGEREIWREGRGERRERGRKGRGGGREGARGRKGRATNNNAYSPLPPSHTSPNPLNNPARILLCSVCVWGGGGGGGVPLDSTDLCNGFGILHYFDVACVGACCYATIRNELQIQAILLPELWREERGREGGKREGRGREEGGIKADLKKTKGGKSLILNSTRILLFSQNQ